MLLLKIVKGNKSLFGSVYQDLIDIVLAYTGEMVKVIIDMYEDEYYQFSVMNNVIDTPKRHLPRTFERFYRVGSGRSGKMGSTG